MNDTECLPAEIALSNSLADLAARIRQEHEASQLHIKRGLGHAIEAGTLLIEAKAQLEHGQWLPWLREHCGVPERSAQRYMELAAHADIKSDNLADLAITGAEDWDLFGRLMLDSPFNADDFERDGDEQWRWINTKLTYQLKVPWIAEWCISVGEERPAFRLCPWDQLCETVTALVPVAETFLGRKTEIKRQPIKFAADTFNSMGQLRGAISVVGCHSAWLLGNVLNEMEYRDGISDKQYEREWDEIHQQVMARLEQRMTKQRGL